MVARKRMSPCLVLSVVDFVPGLETLTMSPINSGVSAHVYSSFALARGLLSFNLCFFFTFPCFLFILFSVCLVSHSLSFLLPRLPLFALFLQVFLLLLEVRRFFCVAFIWLVGESACLNSVVL